jgi:hypothetical protein
MSVPPWTAGSTDVSIDRCDGSVHDETLTASSATRPSRASAFSRGVVGGRYPYAPTWSRRSVSMDTSTTPFARP